MRKGSRRKRKGKKGGLKDMVAKGFSGFIGSHVLPDKETVVTEEFDKDEKGNVSAAFKGFGFSVSKTDGKVTYNVEVIMPLRVYHKLFTYVSLVTEEISGLGKIERVGNTLIITDVFLFKQRNSAASTILDNDDLANAQYEIIQRGEDPSNLKLWWHSHNTMGTTWSGTDDRCCAEFDNGEYLLSLVVNQDRDMRCRIDIYQPFKLTIDGISVQVQDILKQEEDSLIDECQKEILEKVEAKTITYHPIEHAQNDLPYNTGFDSERCPVCGYLKTYCTCETDGDAKKKATMNDDTPIPTVMSDFVTYATDLYTIVGSVIQDSWIFHDIYGSITDTEFEGTDFKDCFGIDWAWDTNFMKYFPSGYNSSVLTEEEYVSRAMIVTERYLKREEEK